MRETREVSKLLEGDDSQHYIGFARTVLGQLKNQLALGGLAQGTSTRRLPDGTVVRAQSIFGQDKIFIIRAGAAPSREEIVMSEPSFEEFEIPTSVPETANYEDEIIPGYGLVACGDYRVPVGAHLELKPFQWRESTGPVPLPFLPGGTLGQAYAISRDGSTIVGFNGVGADSIGCIWRGGDSVETLAGLPVGFIPNDVSADGTIVVGQATPLIAGVSNRVFKWTAARGMEVVATGVYLGFAPAISPDGRYIAGAIGSSSSNAVATVWERDGQVHSLGEAGTRAVDVTDGGIVLINKFGSHRLWQISGDTAGATVAVSGMNTVFAVSDRGRSVGRGEETSTAAFWSEDDGATVLDPGVQTFTSSLAFCISGDGRNIGGSAAIPGLPSNDPPNSDIALWRRIDGVFQLTRIPNPEGTIYSGYISGLSTEKPTLPSLSSAI